MYFLFQTAARWRVLLNMACEIQTLGGEKVGAQIRITCTFLHLTFETRSVEVNGEMGENRAILSLFFVANINNYTCIRVFIKKV